MTLDWISAIFSAVTAGMETNGLYRSSGSGQALEQDVGIGVDAVYPDGDAGRARRQDRRIAAAAVALALFIAAGVGAYVLYASEVSHGVQVLGVHIGGRSRAEAAALLRQRLADRAAAPVKVQVGQVAAEILPEAVGLRVDIDATVANAATVRPNPLAALFGGRDVPPVVVVDQEKLAAALRPHGANGQVEAVRPAIRYQQLTPVPVYPMAGVGLDQQRAADAVRAGWLRRTTVEVPLNELAVQMTREEVDALVRDLATPAVAAPVTVTTSNGQFQIVPAVIAATLVLEAGDDGRISPRIDPAKLRQLLSQQMKAVEKVAKNATIVLRSGAPAVVPHTDGQTLNIDALAANLLGVLPKPAPRRLTAELAVTPPKLTTDGATRLGVKERISSFTTNFAAGQSRTVNIKRMADALRGALILPGETFSLNGHVGERTYAKGYVDAPNIEGGALKNAPGGGVSQVATTTFNAMYYAGLVDVTHRPHSYYFSRYPSVIEATLFWPDLDLKFRNDSSNGILIDTSYTSTSITVSMWGTKRYDIETVWGPRTNPTLPKTVYLQDPTCIATDGLPGFQQEAWRIFKQGGKEVKRQRFFWRYDPEPKFVCGPPPG